MECKGNKRSNMGVEHNDTLDSSVTGRPDENFDYLPIKKRRPRVRSPSPSPPLETSLDGISAPHDPVSDPNPLASNSLVEQKDLAIETTLENTNLVDTKEPFGIELLAAAVSKNSDVDDVHIAKLDVNEDKLSTPQGTAASVDLPYSEETTACVERETPCVKDSVLGPHNDSPDQTGTTDVSMNFLDNIENNAEKCSGSAKDVKFQWDLNTVMDEWESPADDQNIDSTGNGIKNISSENPHSVVSESAGAKDLEEGWKLLKCKSSTDDPAQLLSKSTDLDSGSSSMGRINTSTKLTMLGRENLCTSSIQLGQTLTLKNIKLEKQDNVLASPTVSEKSPCEMVRVKSEEEPIKSVSTCAIPADVGHSSNNSEKAVLPNFLSDNKQISLPVATLDQCQPVLDSVKEETYICVPPNVEMEDQLGPTKDATLVNPSSEVETKELMPKSSEHLDDVALEDPLDDGDVSDLSLGGHDQLVRLGKVAKYQTGGESPFEDGELRETVGLSWEENDIETECLDYDIDDRDAYELDTNNHCMSEAGSESIQNEDNVNLAGKGTSGSVDSLKESSNSASVGNDRITMAVEANISKADEMVVSDPIRKLDPKGSFNEEIRSGATRENFSSRVGDEKDTLYMQPGRSGSRFQAEQEFRCDKYLGRDKRVRPMQDDRQKNNWNGPQSSFLESRKTHFQNNYRRGGILPLPRSSIPDSETDREGLAYHDQRRSANYPNKGSYRPLIRRRPLDNSDNACNTHRGNIESRDEGHGMIRGRSGPYHRGGFRGPRGGQNNHGPISDESAPSWRRRSSSPMRNRNPSFSRPSRRSRSRSRTRSPIPWRQQEERNKGPRMERTRVQYDPKFEENDDAFCSPPRKRFSSQDNGGFFNDRNGGPSSFRGRNSPGRFMGQRQRFDSRGSVERMKSDDSFRPMVHPQRFRGHNYDDNNNNERTKYCDRNETIRRDRHDDNTSGTIRRFRKDTGECCNGHNNRNDNGWEGRGPFKYDRDRM